MVADRYRKRMQGEKVPSRYRFNLISKYTGIRIVEVISETVVDSKGVNISIGRINDITEQIKLEKAKEDLEKRRL